MRLRKKEMQQIQLKKKSEKKDNEGNVFPVFLDPILIEGELWPANNRLQIELYGQRITSILNMICINSILIEIGDGITVDEVEYQVISKKKYTNHSYYEIEKL